MGTVTVSEVVEAAVTGAMVAPKYTMFFDMVSLKLVPVMDTLFNGVPALGDIELMVGTCAWAIVLVSAMAARKDLSIWPLKIREFRVILLIHFGGFSWVKNIFFLVFTEMKVDYLKG